jgi:DNA-binding NtrC family response regulator
MLLLQSGSSEALDSKALVHHESEAPAAAGESSLSPLESAERRVIMEFLQKNNYNQSRTSQELGIRPNTLIAKMRRYNIQPPERPRPGRKPGARPSKRTEGESIASQSRESV